MANFILTQINSLKYTHARTERQCSHELFLRDRIEPLMKELKTFKSMLVNICLSLALIKESYARNNFLRKTEVKVWT